MHVYTYTAGEQGLFVNSYLVELEGGVLAIDGSLLVSDARAFRARLDALRKPLLGVFVTHAHPDHFNGVGELVAGTDAPVYATADVKRVIEEIAEPKRAQWGPVYGDEWPAETRFPDAVLADGETLRLDGVAVSTWEVGPCESHAEAVFTVTAGDAPPVAFIGDLAYSGMHSYNADGHSAAWLRALDAAGEQLRGVARLYPGHGEPGGSELLDRQREYLLMERECVARLAGGRPSLTDAEKAKLEARMAAFAPLSPLRWLIGLSADAVAAELAAETTDAAAVGA